MRLPARIIIPIALAVGCAVVLLGILWWQLKLSALQIDTKPVVAGSNEEDIAPSIEELENPADVRDQALFHLRRGDLLAVRGEWVAAQAEYQLAVDADGGLIALRKLAQAQLQRRETSEIRATIQRMRREGAREEDLLLIESIVDLRSNDIPAARQRLNAAEESPQKHYGLAIAAVLTEEHDVAQQELTAVINGWEPVLRSHARTLQAAYQEFALFPESPPIHLKTLLARALAQIQQCPLALPLLTQVTEQRHDYRDAWIVQGFCELTTERPDDALLSFEQAYNIDPQKPEIQYFLARAYAAVGNPKNAITFAEYALSNGFEPALELRLLIAAQAEADGNMTLALDQYRSMTQDADADIEVYRGYIQVSIHTGQKDEAYTIAKEAVERFPEHPSAYELLGWAAMESDKKDEAKVALEKALEMSPYLPTARKLLEELDH